MTGEDGENNGLSTVISELTTEAGLESETSWVLIRIEPLYSMSSGTVIDKLQHKKKALV